MGLRGHGEVVGRLHARAPGVVVAVGAPAGAAGVEAQHPAVVLLRDLDGCPCAPARSDGRAGRAPRSGSAGASSGATGARRYRRRRRSRTSAPSARPRAGRCGARRDGGRRGRACRRPDRSPGRGSRARVVRACSRVAWAAGRIAGPGGSLDRIDCAGVGGPARVDVERLARLAGQQRAETRLARRDLGLVNTPSAARVSLI